MPLERILFVTPTGGDANNVSHVLAAAGMTGCACSDLAAAARQVEFGCGAIILAEEALSRSEVELKEVLERQPAWSDIPLFLIVEGGHKPSKLAESVRLLGPRANISLIERPLGRASLVSTLQAALRARRRQYEVRRLLHERTELLDSLEQRIALRTAALEEMNGELEAFSYGVSHDLQAPLRSLTGYAHILSKEYINLLPEEGRHCVERIARNSENMERLTRDILTISRLRGSKLVMEKINLDDVVGGVIEQYPDLAAAQRYLAVAYPLGRVLGHGPSLTQCFSNLLQNSLKFVPQGRTPEIRVYSQVRPERVRVSVQDNGVGIDPAHHSRIFGMFERGSATHVPGTGLGLAIVRKAVQRMAGTLGVESAVNAGANFWMELQRVD